MSSSIKLQPQQQQDEDEDEEEKKQQQTSHTRLSHNLNNISNESDDENKDGTLTNNNTNTNNNNNPYDKIPILKRSNLARAASTNGKTTNLIDYGDGCPICVIVIGMAGSGKTTLVTALQNSLRSPDEDEDDDEDEDEDEDEDDDNDNENDTQPLGYCVNLDPAARSVPFGASIDIRDTVDYKQVMKQHGLGPNGAIMTCLNLFSTRFDQVMNILEARSFPEKENKTGDNGDDVAEEGSYKAINNNNNNSNSSVETPTNNNDNKNDKNKDQGKRIQNRTNGGLDYILVDTPGQIEAFTWSASGSIFSSALASSFPTVLAFVVDTPRCIASPHTFMSSMLYACTTRFRTGLPVVLVFTKTDVSGGAECCYEWMDDFDTFQDALDAHSGSGSSGSTGFYSSLTRSMSLVLDEFYRTLKRAGVSAVTGDGMDTFWDAVTNAARDEFDEGYVGDLRRRIDKEEARKEAGVQARLEELSIDA